MRTVVRLIAAVTVVGAVLLSPGFSRRSATVSRPQARLSAPAIRVGAWPENWSERVAGELLAMRVPLDRKEIETVLRAVDDSARRFQVDPLLVLAVIAVESRFDPFAVSPAGAAGLMQLRPETARAVAGDLGIEWTSEDLVFDPATNVTLGTCYLRRLLDRFDDLDAALAAFNAGPTRIERNNAAGTIPLRYADRVWDAILDLRDRVPV